MKTNVQIPAGITKGTEAFWIDGEKWLIHNGESKPFNDYPAAVQNAVVALFRADTESRAILEKYKIKGFIPQFEAWYKCVVGGLDSQPDFENFAKLIPDAFANTCTKTDCPMRGKLCGRTCGLNSREVSTIKDFASGQTIVQVAQSQYVTEAAIKSRVNTIHEKMDVRNMAQLMATAGKLGVF